jgi:hypothetical protein
VENVCRLSKAFIDCGRFGRLTPASRQHEKAPRAVRHAGPLLSVTRKPVFAR